MITLGVDVTAGANATAEGSITVPAPYSRCRRIYMSGQNQATPVNYNLTIFADGRNEPIVNNINASCGGNAAFVDVDIPAGTNSRLRAIVRNNTGASITVNIGFLIVA